jgi:hypothetical protein
VWILLLPLYAMRQASRAVRLTLWLGGALSLAWWGAWAAHGDAGALLRLHGWDDPALLFSALLCYKFWLSFASSPWGYVFAALIIHALRQPVPNGVRFSPLALSGLLLFAFTPTLFLANLALPPYGYVWLAAAFAMPVAGRGLQSAVEPFDRAPGVPSRRWVALGVVVVGYVLGVRSAQNQLVQVLLNQEKAAPAQATAAAVRTAHQSLPADRWLLVADDWGRAPDLPRLTVPGGPLRPDPARTALRTAVAHPLGGVLFKCAGDPCAPPHFATLPPADWACRDLGPYRFCSLSAPTGE